MATVVFVVDKGLTIVTGRMIGTAQGLPSYIGIGSSATAAALTDTALGTEYTTSTWATYARVSAALAQATTTDTDDTVTHNATFTAGAAQTVTEAGDFDAATVGNMFIHGTFTGLALNAGDSLQVTLSCQFTN